MHLVRDLLDKLVVDRHGREVGRVDSIILEIPSGAPPRVARIEIGPAVLFARVRPWMGRWVEGLEHAFGFGDGRPTRVAYEQIADIGVHVKIDAAAGETPAHDLESRARGWLRGMPGGS